MTPGSNLFAAAIRAIKPTTVQYKKYTGRTQNAARQYISDFADEVPIVASVQMVSRSKYQILGLDFQKRYIKIFSQTNIIDLQRDTTGDQIIFGGRLYQVDSNNDWFLQDGWVSCIAIDIGAAT